MQECMYVNVCAGSVGRGGADVFVFLLGGRPRLFDRNHVECCFSNPSNADLPVLYPKLTLKLAAIPMLTHLYNNCMHK